MRPPRRPRGGIPLPRLLSKWHVASRKRAEEAVRAGRVRVNGVVRQDLLFGVDPERDVVHFDGSSVGPPSPRAFTTLVLNKPRGVVTTTSDERGRRTVMDLLPAPLPPGLAPIGRLDKASAGLLLLTNDHDLADRLLDPARHVAKTYRVRIDGHLSEEDLRDLREESLEEDGLELGPMEVRMERENPRSSWLEITLREGRNRQIRRRLAARGFRVDHLVRTRFGPVELGDLPPGECRPLRAGERRGLDRSGAGRAG